MMKKESRPRPGSGAFAFGIFVYSLYLREYALLVT
jgi:hypothetical protein